MKIRTVTPDRLDHRHLQLPPCYYEMGMLTNPLTVNDEAVEFEGVVSHTWDYTMISGQRESARIAPTEGA
jgi:hypothetical protein